MSAQRARLTVFASGGGTNFQAVIDAVETGFIPVDVALLVCSRPDAGALARAERHGIPARVLQFDASADEAAYTAAMLDALREAGTDLIALAGYMKKIPLEVVHAFHHRVLNIHPSLLPAFGGHGMYGMRVHKAVLEYGARWTGATVHLVDEEYDTGPIVLQEPVPVRQDDTPETLARRVLEVEHRLYPEAIRLFASGRISVEGRRVLIHDRPADHL
ncbi:MAG TPA: phosphoribosylglycinamide formyltransferase [Rhodothermales bacterium]|nr:phosphoribosylglycinamide formyltransferase [Rhodothermales bacterium]